MGEAFQLIVFLRSVAEAKALRGVSPSRPLEANIWHRATVKIVLRLLIFVKILNLLRKNHPAS